MSAGTLDRVRAALSRHPLGWPVAPLFSRFDGDPLEDVTALDRALGPLAGVRFERAPPRPARARRRPPSTTPANGASRGFEPARGYDGRITLEGIVPTRLGSLHDLVNALVWAVAPSAKRALHARQHARIAARGGKAASRTREEDALALVDEGGAVVVAAPEAIADVSACVRAEDAIALAGHVAGGRARSVLFGHALYEHLAARVTAVRAAVVLVLPSESGVGDLSLVDRSLDALLREPSALLDPGQLARAPLDALAGGPQPGDCATPRLEAPP